jgi:hypothetical protein
MMKPKKKVIASKDAGAEKLFGNFKSDFSNSNFMPVLQAKRKPRQYKVNEKTAE